jgi:hypothetical protein
MALSITRDCAAILTVMAGLVMKPSQMLRHTVRRGLMAWVCVRPMDGIIFGMTGNQILLKRLVVARHKDYKNEETYLYGI